MKHWLNKNYRSIIISAFLIPIITVAIVSISHVTKWYGISNPISWSIYLSIGVEIAALSALAAISANMGRKVYFPFIVVTLIQFIGNIYFSYSYIDVNSQTFKDWVGLVSPLLEFTGIDPTDFVGHKRVLALFAGGMLPIISLTFLGMLVKFTEEDRKKEQVEDVKEPNTIEAKDLAAEIARVRLSDDDLKDLENRLINSKKPPVDKPIAEPTNEEVPTPKQIESTPEEEKHSYLNQEVQDQRTKDLTEISKPIDLDDFLSGKEDSTVTEEVPEKKN